MRYYLRTYPLTCFCIVLIWYLCLFKPPRTPLEGIPLIDKWVHISMYLGTCSLLWIEYLRAHKRLNGRRIVLFGVLAPILMSGLIELIQENCTETRSGDWLDFAANSLGVLLAALLGRTVYPRLLDRLARRKKQSGDK